MILTHQKWAKRGRIYRNDKGQLVWRTSVSSKNVDLGNGEYAPYVRDDTQKIYKFANSEIRLVQTGIEYWRDAKKLFTGSYFPEIKENDIWQSKPVSISGLSIEESEDEWKKYLAISYKVSTDDQETLVKARIGCTGIIRHEFEIKAKKAGYQRLKYTIDVDGQRIERRSKDNVLIGYNFPEIGVKYRWKKDEIEERSVLLAKNETEIRVKEKHYEKDETQIIRPDSTTLEAAYGADVSADEICYVADGTDWCGWDTVIGDLKYRVCERWDISGIDADWDVTNVEVRAYVEDKVSNPGDFYCNRYGASHGEDDPETDCGNGGNPYDKCQGLNYTSIGEPANTSWTDWMDCGATADSDIEWCRDNAHGIWSCGFDCRDASETEYLVLSEYNEENDAELRVTYTVPGGVAPTAALYGPLVGPMGGPI